MEKKMVEIDGQQEAESGTNPQSENQSLEAETVAVEEVTSNVQSGNTEDKPGKDKRKRNLTMLISGAIVLVGVVCFVATGDLREYSSARKMLLNGEYDKAAEAFQQLDEYKDAPIQYKESRYQKGISLIVSKNYIDAETIFLNIIDYSDAKEKIKECEYGLGLEAIGDKKFEEARKYFVDADGFNDSSEMLKKCDYEEAKQLLNEHKYKDALKEFEKLDDFLDSKEQMKACYFNIGEGYFEEKNYEQASANYELAGEYGNAVEKYKESTYEYGKFLVREYKHMDASKYFEKIDYKDSKNLAKQYSLYETTRYIDYKFHYTPEEFALVITQNMDQVAPGCTAEFIASEDGNAAISILKNGKTLDLNILIEGIDKEAGTFTSLSYINSKFESDNDSSVAIMVMIMNICDLSMEWKEATQLASDLLKQKPITQNGINYEMVITNTKFMLQITAPGSESSGSI